MEVPSEIRSDASLFEAVQQIVEHECVLVRDTTRKLTGIITTEDLSRQFAQLGEPFLLLGQIENHIEIVARGGKPEIIRRRQIPSRSTKCLGTGEQKAKTR